MALTEAQIKALPYDPRKRPDPGLELPDLKDAVTGWRAWRCSTDPPRFGLTPKLFSATYGGYYWAPHRASVAECSPGKCDEEGEVPGETCTCGFYSAKSVKHLLTMGYHRYNVETREVAIIGKVACWGKVIEGGQGWRSEFAYPVALYIPFEAAAIAKPLADGYGCKVALANLMKGA